MCRVGVCVLDLFTMSSDNSLVLIDSPRLVRSVRRAPSIGCLCSIPGLSTTSLTSTSILPTHPPQTTLLPHPLCLKWMQQYYHGIIPSKPAHVQQPLVLSHIADPGSVTSHRLNDVMVGRKKHVAPQVHACLDGLGVKWTSTNVVRFGEA